MDWVEDIPFGLAACFLNGEQATVVCMTDERVRVRFAEEIAVKSVRICFLQNDYAGYASVESASWRVESVKNAGSMGFEYELWFEDGAFRREALRALKLLANYIRLKQIGDDEYLAHSLSGCPYAETEALTLDAQKKEWLGSLRGMDIPGNWSLALSLDRPELYERFLNVRFPEFQKEYLSRSYLDQHSLFTRRADRVYIGNEYCFKLFPSREALRALLARTEKTGVSATVVLPPVRQRDEELAASLLSDVGQSRADEISVSDWGALNMAKTTGKRIVLGTLLNKRKKDPRLFRKSGAEALFDVLGQNALNAPAFQAWLKSAGVERCEYEACGYPLALAPGKHSLHLPFYQTNTSSDCPLAAECFSLDPGKRVEDCQRVCLKNARLYPDWMKLVGRYNSLFALDAGILRDSGLLEGYLSAGIDRLVLNAL